MIGINQRDLETFIVDNDAAQRLLPLIPEGIVAVAESGVKDGRQARSLYMAGADAILVGEALVRSGDPAAAVRSLREAAVS